MKHLSDEQLGARLDGELPAKAAEAAERHLAECSVCRERLAALSGADASLSSALSHDPGEQYFETFAERVQVRIAAGAAKAGPREARAADGAPSGGGWFSRPSTLAWAGAAVTLVAVGVFALQIATQPGAGARHANERQNILGQSAPEDTKERSNSQVAPEGREADALARGGADANEPRAGAARVRMAQGSQLDSRGEPTAAAPHALEMRAPVQEEKSAGAKNETTTPSRMQPVRTLPNGEQAPSQSPAPLMAAPPKSFAAPPTDAAKTQKPAARSMAPAPASAPPAEMRKSTATRDLEANAKRVDEQLQKQKAVAAAPPPKVSGAVTQSSEIADGVKSPDADQATPFKLCGKVTNAQGRTVAGATVTVVETGHSVSSGSDGSFCLEAPSPGATLSVLSLGYQEYRAKVSEEVSVAPLAVTLRSVETLGPGGTPTARLETVPAPVATKGFANPSSGMAGKDAAKLGAASTIPALPGETPDATAARRASEEALRSNSPLLWSKAGGLWTGVAASAKTEAAANEARFRTAEARMHTWRFTHAGADRTAAAMAVDGFLAKAPAGEQRRFAENWRGELAAK